MPKQVTTFKMPRAKRSLDCKSKAGPSNIKRRGLAQARPLRTQNQTCLLHVEQDVVVGRNQPVVGGHDLLHGVHGGAQGAKRAAPAARGHPAGGTTASKKPVTPVVTGFLLPTRRNSNPTGRGAEETHFRFVPTSAYLVPKAIRYLKRPHRRTLLGTALPPLAAMLASFLVNRTS